MGFFRKKKNTDSSSSVLSESEIQKKLYGEFSEDISHVVTGDRESLKVSAVAPSFPKESSLEKDASFDLFNVQREALSDPEFSPRQVSPEQKPVEHASRYVPLHDFERKPAPSASASSSSDLYARFRHKPSLENKLPAFLDFIKGFSGKTGEWVRFFLDPRQVALRRIFYWGTAGLVVFLLFWGVNALNSQREEAMRVRYKIPGESIPAKPTVPVAAVVSSASVAERPVVVTPVPVRASKPSSGQSASKADPYVIQVVTYPSSQDADSIVKALKSSGFSAFVKENTRSSGRVFYMVLIGGFRTAAEAQSQLLKFRGQEVARPFQDAFVRTNRS